MAAKRQSSYKKGNQYENEVKHILEREGWKVEGQHRKAAWINGKLLMMGRDIFSCDLIAKCKGSRTLWIQVSTLANKSKKIKQMQNEPWDYSYDQVQVWCRLQGKKCYQVFTAPDWKLAGYWYVNLQGVQYE